MNIITMYLVSLLNNDHVIRETVNVDISNVVSMAQIETNIVVHIS